jgi:hypothetical protein
MQTNSGPKFHLREHRKMSVSTYVRKQVNCFKKHVVTNIFFLINGTRLAFGYTLCILLLNDTVEPQVRFAHKRQEVRGGEKIARLKDSQIKAFTTYVREIK